VLVRVCGGRRLTFGSDGPIPDPPGRVQLPVFRRCSLLTYPFRYARRSRLEKQPTDRRRKPCYLWDRTLDLHPDAKCEISFQRTLRIPDNDETWPLRPGLGRFPIVHVDDFAATLPPKWKEHGGVAFPMYQSEAMWIAFSGNGYPFAIKIAAGKIDAERLQSTGST
jgi:hypothetical protein